jgi:hypothetical protein
MGVCYKYLQYILRGRRMRGRREEREMRRKKARKESKDFLNTQIVVDNIVLSSIA